MCQNSSLTAAKIQDISDDYIVERYLSNDISKAIVFGGLEPLDQFDELLALISAFREQTDDDIVIYTGYNREEVLDKEELLRKHKDIVVKYGRYIPDQEKHFDEVIGVYLASDNQYAVKIS